MAADHGDIAEAVDAFGGNVVMTDPRAASGTDRVAEVAQKLNDVDILVNMQGDEPELSGDAIDLAIELLESHPDAAVSTLATPIRNREVLEDPACVKVVFDSAGRALYFSRSVIPHLRTSRQDAWTANPPHFYLHIGLYAYRREFLLQFKTLPSSRLEQLEELEQLRVLESGHDILVGIVHEAAVGIDTLSDYQAFVRRTLGDGG